MFKTRMSDILEGVADALADTKKCSNKSLTTMANYTQVDLFDLISIELLNPNTQTFDKTICITKSEFVQWVKTDTIRGVPYTLNTVSHSDTNVTVVFRLPTPDTFIDLDSAETLSRVSVFPTLLYAVPSDPMAVSDLSGNKTSVSPVYTLYTRSALKNPTLPTDQGDRDAEIDTEAIFNRLIPLETIVLERFLRLFEYIFYIGDTVTPNALANSIKFLDLLQTKVISVSISSTSKSDFVFVDKILDAITALIRTPTSAGIDAFKDTTRNAVTEYAKKKHIDTSSQIPINKAPDSRAKAPGSRALALVSLLTTLGDKVFDEIIAYSPDSRTLGSEFGEVLISLNMDIVRIQPIDVSVFNVLSAEVREMYRNSKVLSGDALKAQFLTFLSNLQMYIADFI